MDTPALAVDLRGFQYGGSRPYLVDAFWYARGDTTPLAHGVEKCGQTAGEDDRVGRRGT